MNLDCNFKPPKQSQHKRLMSAAAPNKELFDSRSLSLTLTVHLFLENCQSNSK